jgi:Carboxypeptidase regulatory-like domain
MFYRTKVLAASFVAVAGVFSGAAFGQSIEGTVRGPDGKALKDAEVRVEQKGNKSVVTTKTDAGGHYSHARLSPGVYKVSVVLGGAEKSSVNVKTTTTNSRIDFDLKPAAAKKVKHYVWVPARTGSHVGSGWVEVDDGGNAAPGALNSQTSSAELAREMQRRSTNPTRPGP